VDVGDGLGVGLGLGLGLGLGVAEAIPLKAIASAVQVWFESTNSNLALLTLGLYAPTIAALIVVIVNVPDSTGGGTVSSSSHLEVSSGFKAVG
jgi:hypothetical protein